MEMEGSKPSLFLVSRMTIDYRQPFIAKVTRVNLNRITLNNQITLPSKTVTDTDMAVYALHMDYPVKVRIVMGQIEIVTVGDISTKGTV